MSEEGKIASRIFSRKLKIDSNDIDNSADDNEIIIDGAANVEIFDEDNNQENNDNIDILIEEDEILLDSNNKTDIVIDETEELNLDFEVEEDESVDISFDGLEGKQDSEIQPIVDLDPEKEFVDEKSDIQSQVDIDVDEENNEVNLDISGDFDESENIEDIPEEVVIDFSFSSNENDDIPISFDTDDQENDIDLDELEIDDQNAEEIEETIKAEGKIDEEVEEQIIVEDIIEEVELEIDEEMLEVRGEPDEFDFEKEMDKKLREDFSSNSLQLNVPKLDPESSISENITPIINDENISSDEKSINTNIGDNIDTFEDKYLKDRANIIKEYKLITIDEIKSYFKDELEESKKELAYKTMREVEMQYIFESFLKEFDIKDFERTKKSINGDNIINFLMLNSNALVDIYFSQNATEKLEILEGESSFILGDDLELKVEKHFEDIKIAKLNCEYVYLVVLKGTVVSEEEIKLSDKYGVKIIMLDKHISIINKNLENIKKEF